MYICYTYKNVKIAVLSVSKYIPHTYVHQGALKDLLYTEQSILNVVCNTQKEMLETIKYIK